MSGNTKNMLSVGSRSHNNNFLKFKSTICFIVDNGRIT